MGADAGRRAVLGDAMAAASADVAAAHDAAAGDQLPLFDVPTRFLGARADAARAAGAAHRAGRPAGAVNKSTAALRRYLLARGVHPLQALMQWALHTPESLAQELGCTRLEAFREWKALQAELAPYFAARVVPTDESGNAVPFFVMQVGASASIGTPGAVSPPWLSHDPVSHEGEK